MSLPPADIDLHAVVRAFVEARRAGRSIAAFPGQVPRSIDEAYRAQSLAIDAWRGELAGWKVAKINDPWRDPLGVDRFIGPIFDETIVRDANTCIFPAYRGGQAAFEVELALTLACDADPRRTDWRSHDAALLVGEVNMAVEFAASPLGILTALGPLASISGFGNNNGLLLGPVISLDATMISGSCEALIDVQSVGAGPLWTGPDGPLPAFAFALNEAARLGRPMTKGQIVSTGALTGVHPVQIGQACEADFKEFGRLLCTVQEQEPA
ncbi:2-keto-4-pentenoate hydratase [Sphingobium sp. CR2-8]|uniref:2-keto-4-pentenoate hydratase n=1 Tax=Sphingobium sp. CR2-8 TaxID=1306534 RepID=UPI002DB65DCB|nr:2-keto-4-pentenoate hydratase [Sphingobium sp. CR2-8]MEC3909576.1 2-keto-4-pentenoate hydratase [Sphingobium sp. CR2-8]